MILSVIGLAVVFYLLLYHLAPALMSEAKLFANRELTVLLSITVGFGAAWAAHKLHISPALGAFVAGMLLRITSYNVCYTKLLRHCSHFDRLQNAPVGQRFGLDDVDRLFAD